MFLKKLGWLDEALLYEALLYEALLYEALLFYNKAIELNPSIATIYNNKGR